MIWVKKIRGQGFEGSRVRVKNQGNRGFHSMLDVNGFIGFIELLGFIGFKRIGSPAQTCGIYDKGSRGQGKNKGNRGFHSMLGVGRSMLDVQGLKG